MSEFDKEAEREKLRKQFEHEEERRQTTQEMSELLLKGATMLNIHCADCASPIFRHEGQEFCPTCHRSVEEIQTAGDDFNSQDEPKLAEETVETTPETTPEQSVSATTPRQPVSIPDSNAGEALDAAIARLADRAATADDPRQASELLEAAHTAAKTLALIEGRTPSK